MLVLIVEDDGERVMVPGAVGLLAVLTTYQAVAPRRRKIISSETRRVFLFIKNYIATATPPCKGGTIVPSRVRTGIRNSL